MNILAERSFPSFFKGYAPKLLKFYSDWLDWTEGPGNAQYMLNHLSTEQDIDESINSYKNHLRAKLLVNFPERTATDLKLLLKNVLWLYRAKSSRKAYDFMFRVLFNSPAVIWHPRDTMLKTSDGRWDVPQYVGIDNTNEELHALINQDRIENKKLEISISNWLIENCLGWRMTGEDTKTEAFVAAASSGYSGQLECRASQISSLLHVALYRNYGKDNQEQLKKSGAIECDPTLKAFKVSYQPELTSSSDSSLNDEMITAVWTINKKKEVVVFPKNKSVVEIGTNSFLEPSVDVVGKNGTYEAINLEAFNNGSWNDLTIASYASSNEATNEMLKAFYVDDKSVEHVAFTIAIESDGKITLESNLPIKKKGKGTSETHLATFYVESIRKAHIGKQKYSIEKSAEIRLENIKFGKYHLVAKDVFENKDLLSDAVVDEENTDSSIFVHLLFDWSDSPETESIDAIYHSFEIPVSNISISLQYSFDKKAYELIPSRIVNHDLIAHSTIDNFAVDAVIPANSESIALEVSLSDPIVTIDSKNVFGILLDNPNAHFAPGEKVHLLNPDTGEIPVIVDSETGNEVEIVPSIVWYAEAEGHYTSSKGFLSDINAIQDNHYWQNYSYVVQSYVGINEWRHIVKNLLHPAGLEIFGEMLLEGDLEDGNGIYYLEEQTYLRKLCVFFKKMIAMSKVAINRAELILSSSMLAQRHSITPDLWLHWITSTGDLRETIKQLKRELFETVDIEERKELEKEISELENILSSPWMEDIRDWYDIRPKDVDELLNANSVLLFRDNGTLINPEIVDWVNFHFTENIDEEFDIPSIANEKASLHTTSIIGTTLHPLHPMIHGKITGNEYFVTDEQEFIPSLYMAFVGSTQESAGVMVKSLTIKNKVLQYSNIVNTSLHESVFVSDTILYDYARKFLLNSNTTTTTQNSIDYGIRQWQDLLLEDFVYVDIDHSFIFNRQSLLKIPDAWTSTVEISESNEEAKWKYSFSKNAWNNENISIVSYSPYDFSYKIWVERINNTVQCSITAFNIPPNPAEKREDGYPAWRYNTLFNRAEPHDPKFEESGYPPLSFELPLTNSNLHVDEEHPVVDEVVYVEPSGWNGRSRNIHAATKSWTLSFDDPEKISTWFNIQLPEIVDNDHLLCFVNGLLQPKSRIKGNTVSIDTVHDNTSITYSSDIFDFGELSLEEFILDDDNNFVLDEDGNPKTKLVLVSLNESDTIAFQETTLEDWLVFDEEMSSKLLGNFTLNESICNILGCKISTAMVYAELYVLAPIEGSRKLKYPWTNSGLKAKNNEYGIIVYDADDPSAPQKPNIWPFTYDNARLFPYSAHNEFITSIKDGEVWPNRQIDNPNLHWEVEYRNVSRLLNGYRHSLIITETVASQRQSETVDGILAGWWDHSICRSYPFDASQETESLLDSWWEHAGAPRNIHLDFAKNDQWLASTNESSTLVFGEDGLLVDPSEINWAGGPLIGCENKTYGVPEKWWSRPILAEHPVESGIISANGILASSSEMFKQERYLAFIDGLKILDSEISASDCHYQFNSEHHGKNAVIFSMGKDWILENAIDNNSIRKTGYFNAKKNGSSWTITAKTNGSYVFVRNVPALNDIDLVEFAGLEMTRKIGKIWAEDESVAEITGITEILSANGDKRRFADYRFIDDIRVVGIVNGNGNEVEFNRDLKLGARYPGGVCNNYTFGIVDHIVDIDPRFLMIFIDGRYSPMESGEWRYIKGTLFFSNDPQETIEVYIGNSFSYLLPDFAKTVPGCIDDIVFNNLRTNVVPRHHTQLIDWKKFGLNLGFRYKREIEWRRLYKFGLLEYVRKNWINEVQIVQKQSETFDDILYWKQMRPNAWLDVDDPMKFSNKSSMLVFDVHGNLIDNIHLDWHRKLMVPSGLGNTIEILRPSDTAYTGEIYFPAWEYDTTDDHSLHKAPFVSSNGKIEGRYKELIESNWNIVYIDGEPYNYDQWFKKHLADLHLEESIFIHKHPITGPDLGTYDEPELSKGENLLLSYELLDNIIKQDCLNGKLHSFQIEATRQFVRGLIVESNAMELAIEVPSIFGSEIVIDGVEHVYEPMVFVDGIKVPEYAVKKRVVRNGVEVVPQGATYQKSDIPSTGTVKQYIVVDGTVYEDSLEHVMHVYWPAPEYGNSISQGNLCNLLYSNSEYVFWEGIWRSVCSDTYCWPELQEGLERLLQHSGFMEVVNEWINEEKTSKWIKDTLKLTSSPTAAQLAHAIVRYAPKAVPVFVDGIKTFGTEGDLTEIYKLFASCIKIDPPHVEQFREYVKNRFLLFFDGRQVPVSVDSSGRIVVLPDVQSSIIKALEQIDMYQDINFTWKVLGENERLDDLEYVSIDVHPTDQEWNSIYGPTTYLVAPDYAEAAIGGQLEVQSQVVQVDNGLQIMVEVDEYGKLKAYPLNRQVFVENCNPDSFELYCIDLSNSVLRTSTLTSSEAYQSLHFQNHRIFPFVEVDTSLIDSKIYDWKIQYFIRHTDFKNESTIYMNKIGWYHSGKLSFKAKVENVSETIDDVLKRQQMAPSAWAGLDFDILSKCGKSSIMLFSENGTLVDPADIDFSDGTINPWQTGKVVEVLLPSDIAIMSKIYWPIYEVDPVEHSLPFSETDSRFKNLHDAEHSVVVVDGLTFDIERNFKKILQFIHPEESTWIYPRPEHVFNLGRYSSFLKKAGWDNSSAVENDAEHLLLTDVIMEEDASISGKKVLGISIDASYAMHRTVQTVLENGRFLVSVPRVNGELVFVDGVKIPDGTFKRIAFVNGREAVVTSGEIDENAFTPGDDIQYAIEIEMLESDDNEHVVAVYWPYASDGRKWAENYIASPSNLQNAINISIQSNWTEYGFETFKEYVQSRFVLFCNGHLALLSGNADGKIFINTTSLSEYECSSYELYVVDLSNINCRTSESPYSDVQQIFSIDNQQKNIFMESHHDESFFGIQALDATQIHLNSINVHSLDINMTPITKKNEFETENIYWVANNRDTLDNVFCRGSIPVRQYINPSLYVEQTEKIEFVGQTDDFAWKVLGEGENVDDLEFVAIDVSPLDIQGNEISGEKDVLVPLEAMDFIEDDHFVLQSSYVPQSWNFTLYATARENPSWFLPCERLNTSQWKFYKGWNQRLQFFDLEPNKNIYIVEILDVSMENSIANTDAIYWLEKEFNKKSTLIIDNDGLLEHPDGLEWCDGYHIFPHEGKWTAQAEEAEFPAVVNELVPDNIKKARIMDLCLNDVVGYNQALGQVADASIDVLVATNARIYRTSLWEVLANKDYIYWEQGEFKNWIAWLEDDDVFDRWRCFVFVNGFKIPDWMWTFDVENNAITIPLSERHLIERLGFVRKDMMYDERIYEENVQKTLIDPDLKVVYEAEYNVPVIVDATWVIWKDKNGFPVWGSYKDIPDESTEVLCVKPDPREGIIWPISRIWKYFNSCTSAGIDIPEYLGHDLSKYVLAWVDGRLVQCTFEGTRIFVPGCESAETVEVYVFELHDGAWIERFNAVPDSYTLTSFRDMKVC